MDAKKEGEEDGRKKEGKGEKDGWGKGKGGGPRVQVGCGVEACRAGLCSLRTRDFDMVCWYVGVLGISSACEPSEENSNTGGVPG